MYRLFLSLAEYDEKTSLSRIVSTNEFKDQYNQLKLGNGGSWCRMDSAFAKKFKYVLRKNNNSLSFSWNPSVEETMSIQKEFNNLEIGKNNIITHIKIYGTKDSDSLSRSIREDIREYFKNSLCVVCGNSDVEIDHKNGLYNNSRVLNMSTQVVEDFQTLCRHCNQQKRQSIIYTKQTGRRYPATMIPQLKIFGIPFTQGDETFDEKDVDAMVGTYWYDPVDFIKKIRGISV